MFLPEINVKISLSSVEETSTAKQTSNVQIPVPMEDISQGVTFLANQEMPSPVCLGQISQMAAINEIPTPFSQIGATISEVSRIPEPQMNFVALSHTDLPEPQESKKKKQAE